MPANLENTGQVQFSFQSQRKLIPNNAQTPLHSSHTLVMLKILQARVQHYVNCDIPNVQAGFRKGRGTRDYIANRSSKKQESSRKTSISALLTMPKPLTVWITINCEKF